MPFLGDNEFLAPFWQFDTVTFFRLGQKTKSDFFHKKITFCFIARSKQAIFSPNCVFGPFLAFWLRDIFLTWSENKKWFFSQNNHFLFTKQSILMAGKLAAVITQIYFGKFCYCVPGWKILKHGFFEPLRDHLWPCDSLLLWTRLFIQILSETLFIGKWPSHFRFKIWILSKKWVHNFCLPDSLKSQPLRTIHYWYIHFTLITYLQVFFILIK